MPCGWSRPPGSIRECRPAIRLAEQLPNTQAGQASDRQIFARFERDDRVRLRLACLGTLPSQSLSLGGLSAEALDAAARVHQFLFARVKRVALRAQLDVNLRLGRSRYKAVPTRTRDFCDHVVRMDSLSHLLLQKLTLNRSETQPWMERVCARARIQAQQHLAISSLRRPLLPTVPPLPRTPH